jgi:integrase/recombinase XerD
VVAKPDCTGRRSYSTTWAAHLSTGAAYLFGGQGAYDVITQLKFSEAFEDCIIAKRAKGVSDGYIKILDRTGAYWIADNGDGLLSEITPTQLRQWLIGLQATRGLSSSGADIFFRNIKTFFLFCEREEYLEPGRSPIRKIERPQVEEKEPDVLTPHEVQHLLRKVRTSGDRHAFRDYTIHLFLSVTCVRVSELVALDWSNIFLREGYASVYSTKTNKQRFVPITPELARALTNYRRKHRYTVEGDDAVFTNERGQRLQTGGVRQIVLRDFKEFISRPICKCGPHTWRRTGCTNYLDSDVPIQDMQVIMGHSSIVTTLRYRKKGALQTVLALNGRPGDKITRGNGKET